MLERKRQKRCGGNIHQRACLARGPQAARAQAAGGRDAAAEAAKAQAAAAKRVADAVAERDLARQMLKGVQAMLGHAEAARSSAQKALQQAQAEKAASQACHRPPPTKLVWDEGLGSICALFKMRRLPRSVLSVPGEQTRDASGAEEGRTG